MKRSLEHRIPPVAVTLVSAALMWLIAILAPAYPLPEKLRLISMFLFVAAALAFGILGVVAFHHANTTVNPLLPENCSHLVDDGIFRFTRNPMYLALLLALVGWGLFLGNLWSLLMVVVFAWYINRYQIRPEEQALEAAFGDDFRRYRQRVRKWL